MAKFKALAAGVLVGLAVVACSSETDGTGLEDTTDRDVAVETAQVAAANGDASTRDRRAGAERIVAQSAAPADAQAADAARLAEIGAREFDIAGIRLGDSPAEVEAALSKVGYSPSPVMGTGGRHLGMSFDQAVRKSVGKVDPDDMEESTVSMMLYNKGDETVSTLFLPFPDGPTAAAVTYVNAASSVEIADLLPAALEKYGEPDVKNEVSEKVWSNASFADPDCDDTEVDVECVTLEDDYNAVKLTLTGNGKSMKALEALIKAEGKRLSGPVGTTF